MTTPVGAEQVELRRSHSQEVKKGARFEFGKNWSRFLSNLTVPRIRLAEQSLRNFLQIEDLRGTRFLDIGSGSGLFSLAARRLGASVHSFDYDPHSVACTRELQRRYFNDDPDWFVEHASVLDKDYLATLGTFDIVYSWGVLHHTGQMWTALDNVKPLVPIGGRLFIAIYNDQDLITNDWERVKRNYCRLPKLLASLYALNVIVREEWKTLSDCRKRNAFDEWVRTWTHYDEVSTRGMSRWHDWIDWIGGYPYERATVEEIVDFYSADGFRLTKLLDCSGGYGCNEFVFTREAAAGVFIENPIPGGTSLGHRFGRRVIPPFEIGDRGITGVMPNPPSMPAGGQFYLVHDGEVSATELLPHNRVLVPGVTEVDQLDGAILHVIAMKKRELAPPYAHTRGQMWEVPLPDFAESADSSEDASQSSLLLFENTRRLALPHSRHDDIDKLGEGRYSHWSGSLYFSTTDGTDPNTNGRSYWILTAARPISPDCSLAKQAGFPVNGPFVRDDDGWKAMLGSKRTRAGSEYLLRDDEIIGPVVRDDDGKVTVASLDASESSLAANEFYIAHGWLLSLAKFSHERGQMWRATMRELIDVADNGDDGKRSPIFVFEDGKQLPFPHSPHDDIDRIGQGRFSHWGDGIYFSSSDGTDPSSNGRIYSILLPVHSATLHSFAQQFGMPVLPPFEQGEQGWTATIDPELLPPRDGNLYLFCDDSLVGEAVIEPSGRLRIADLETSLLALQKSKFMLVAAGMREIADGCWLDRGMMWIVRCPDLMPFADDNPDGRPSPVFVFEDECPLPLPHARHDDIAELGGGRFSHWSDVVRLSTTDGSDPKSNGRMYRLLWPARLLPAKRSFAACYGYRLDGPFERNEEGWTAAVDENRIPPLVRSRQYVLLRDDELDGPVDVDAQGQVRIAGLTVTEAFVASTHFALVPGQVQRLARPFQHEAGQMWKCYIPELTAAADDALGGDGSSLFLFEDGKQLAIPHAPHAEIEASGGGRFSHWGDGLFFSSSDGTDPNLNERSYEMVVVAQPPSEVLSFGQRFGRLIAGAFRRDEQGWTAEFADDTAGWKDEVVLLFRDDSLIGVAEIDDGRITIATPDTPASAVNNARFYALWGRVRTLQPPLTHERQRLWRSPLPEFVQFAERDREGEPSSPLYLFEDGRELRLPHAPHDEIAELGNGRFVHWDESVWFSTSDGSDPNENGRCYRAIIPT